MAAGLSSRSSRGAVPDARRELFISDSWTIGLAGWAGPEPLADAARVHRRLFARWHAGSRTRRCRSRSCREWAQTQGSQWRHYRGGRTHPIRLITSRRRTRSRSCRGPTATTPRRCGSGTPCYFLSDRNGTTNLFSYDPRTKQLSQLTRHDDFDIMSASAGAGRDRLRAGRLHLTWSMSATEKASRLTIDVVGDFPWARPQIQESRAA